MTDSRTSRDKPTTKQLRYLKGLASNRGESFRYPRTRQEASVEIHRLKGRRHSSLADRRREARAVSRDLSAGGGDATAIRPEEIEGYGSSARWK
jgi:hypothetical protein